MATRFSLLGWKIPWAEEPDELQSTGSQRVEHNLATEHEHIGNRHTHIYILAAKLGWKLRVSSGILTPLFLPLVLLSIPTEKSSQYSFSKETCQKITKNENFQRKIKESSTILTLSSYWKRKKEYLHFKINVNCVKKDVIEWE